MEFVVGISLGVLVALFATGIGFARDRAFYPTVLIVIASYYGLFAVMGGSMSTLAIEAVPMAGFFVLAIAGFKRSGWFLAGGLIAHGLFDFMHSYIIENAGMPLWWPGFCGSVDVTLGMFMLFYLLRSRVPA